MRAMHIKQVMIAKGVMLITMASQLLYLIQYSYLAAPTSLNVAQDLPAM